MSLLPASTGRLMIQIWSLHGISTRPPMISTFSSSVLGPWRHNSPSIRRSPYSRLTCSTSATTSQEGHLQVPPEELKQELISAMSEELSSLEVGSVGSLHEALKVVDLMQGLGIRRFFEPHIQRVLKMAYKQWDERCGLIDADATLLGFRLLRHEGYHVYGDVLKKIKEEDNCNTSVITERVISRLLNLYKCSQTGFPQESEVMVEIYDYSTANLIKILSDTDSYHLLTTELRKEIEFALNYPRQCSLSRLEARSIIRRSWNCSEGFIRNCLELAFLDLETLQKHYQQEVQELERWLDEQGFKELQNFRLGLLKCYVGSAISMFEPQFSLYRVTYAKIGILVVILDDLFDLPTSDYQGLALFHEAFMRWDAAPLENLPQHKLIFDSLYQNLTEIATAASKAQDHDVLPFIKGVWEELVSAMLKEAEWKFSGYVPSFEEYLTTAAISMTTVAFVATVVLFLGEQLSDKALRLLIGKGSRLLFLGGVISRLANDLRTVDKEDAEGKLFNGIACYAVDHPECTREDAVATVEATISASFREMEQEMSACREVLPESCIRAILGWVQNICITYRKVDGFTESDAEYAELVSDYMGTTLRGEK